MSDLLCVMRHVLCVNLANISQDEARLLQVWPSRGQVGTKLGQVEPSWVQAGFKLGPSWAPGPTKSPTANRDPPEKAVFAESGAKIKKV